MYNIDKAKARRAWTQGAFGGGGLFMELWLKAASVPAFIVVARRPPLAVSLADFRVVSDYQAGENECQDIDD
jgi:hypothetical protein